MGAPTQGGYCSCRSATALRTTWLRVGGRGGLQGEKLISWNISEVACARELMRGWEGEEENPNGSQLFPAQEVWVRGALTSGGAHCRGPGSGPRFPSAAGHLLRSLEGPPLPSRGHVSTAAPVLIPAPLLQTFPSQPGWPGRGQRSEGKESGGQYHPPLVDGSKTDLCHEAHPSLKSAGPPLGSWERA